MYFNKNLIIDVNVLRTMKGVNLNNGIKQAFQLFSIRTCLSDYFPSHDFKPAVLVLIPSCSMSSSTGLLLCPK